MFLEDYELEIGSEVEDIVVDTAETHNLMESTLELESSYNNIMTEAMIMEHRSIVRNEGSDKPGIGAKIKEFFQKMWEMFKSFGTKIANFFRNLISKLSVMFTNADKFVKKNATDIKVGKSKLASVETKVRISEEALELGNTVDKTATIYNGLTAMVKEVEGIIPSQSEEYRKKFNTLMMKGTELASKEMLEAKEVRLTSKHVDMALAVIKNFKKNIENTKKAGADAIAACNKGIDACKKGISKASGDNADSDIATEKAKIANYKLAISNINKMVSMTVSMGNKAYAQAVHIVKVTASLGRSKKTNKDAVLGDTSTNLKEKKVKNDSYDVYSDIMNESYDFDDFDFYIND